MKPKEELKIVTVQSSLHWENVAANLKMFAQKIALISSEVDIIVLPEMFNTGFSMNAEQLAEPMGGLTMYWMQEQAKLSNALVIGSLIVAEDGHYYNRMLCVSVDGCISYYDKRHLFAMAKEEKTFAAGQKQGVLNWKGWEIALFVCYDLRFPAWNRNQNGYDLAIYVANWPAKRAYHWRSLLVARAIENQAYVVAVNRVGEDGKGFYYSGDSSVISPIGEILYHQADQEASQIHSLSLAKLKEWRLQFPFLSDRDSFYFDD